MLPTRRNLGTGPAGCPAGGPWGALQVYLLTISQFVWMDENDLRETPNHRLFSISLQKDILDLHPRAGGMGWTTPCLPHEAGESNNQTNGEYLPYYLPSYICQCIAVL